jgi:hypothetical protein
MRLALSAYTESVPMVNDGHASQTSKPTLALLLQLLQARNFPQHVGAADII